MCIQIAARESNGQVIRVSGAYVAGGELQLAGRGRAVIKRKPESSMLTKRCFAKRPFAATDRGPDATSAAESAAKNLVGSAYAILPGGDACTACAVYRYGLVSCTEHCGAVNRHQSTSVEHKGSFLS